MYSSILAISINTSMNVSKPIKFGMKRLPLRPHKIIQERNNFTTVCINTPEEMQDL